MTYCTNCGASLKPGLKFCTECGTACNTATPPSEPPTPSVSMAEPPPPAPQAPPPAVSQALPVYQTAPPVSAVSPSDAPPAGSKYELITTGGFIGISLLMCIPFVGLILMIVWACGGCRKLQKRNFARAALILALIGFIVGLIVSFAAKSIWKKTAAKLTEEYGITSEADEKKGLLSGLLGSKKSSSTGNEELDELSTLLKQLEGVTGDDYDADKLIDGVADINKDAAAHSDGWPSELPDFPSGSMNQTTDYRTEYIGTTLEDTTSYIKTLKKHGFAYQDFYDFGMTEEEMMEYGGWWGYDGKWYLSVSYYDGTTTIDHTTKLPDMDGLLD